MSKKLRKNINIDKDMLLQRYHIRIQVFFTGMVCVCARFRNTTQNIDAITNRYIYDISF